MKGYGNSIDTILRKIYFYCLPTSEMRTRYITKHRVMFHELGNDIFWQPRNLPSDPELISIGNNVKISSEVLFVNHDIVHKMLKAMPSQKNTFDQLWGGV